MFQPSIFRCKLAVGHLPKKNASEASPNSSTARSVLLMEGTHKLTFMDIHWFSCLLAGSKIDGSVRYPSLEEIVKWFKSPVNHLIYKYTIIYRVLAPSQVVVTDFWTIKSILRFTPKKGLLIFLHFHWHPEIWGAQYITETSHPYIAGILGL